MSEPTTTFRDAEGAPLRRWAVRAGMQITSTTYDAGTGALEVVVADRPDTPAPLPMSVVNTEGG